MSPPPPLTKEKHPPSEPKPEPRKLTARFPGKYYFVFAGKQKPRKTLEVGRRRAHRSSADGRLAFNLLVTFPTIFLCFKETNQVSLEDIDLLFGERALGTLPADLNKEGAEMRPTAQHAEMKHDEEASRG